MEYAQDQTYDIKNQKIISDNTSKSDKKKQD
jgi:hypothetical protein